MKVLVTGVGGFVGTHLADALIENGHGVIGVNVLSEIDPALNAKLDAYYQCDLTDPSEVKKLPWEEISGVVNLAGLAAVGPSFDDPERYMKINTEVLSVPYEEIISRGLASHIRMIAVSSGGVYADGQQMPLTEGSSVNPKSSPYAASKLEMEALAQKYSETGLRCVTVRPFNHIGPGQGLGFLLPDLFSNLRAALESNTPLKVGNLTTKRDYTDVRDVVAAYVALLEADRLSYPTYNVCSGRARSGEEILDELVKIVGKPKDIIVDEKLFRPSDAPILFGDSSRLQTDTGWKPSISLHQTIADFAAVNS